MKQCDIPHTKFDLGLNLVATLS